MELNAFGRILDEEWQRTAAMRPGIRLDEYVIMPNHFHAIVGIDYQGIGGRGPEDAKQSLDRIILGFKAACTRRVKTLRRQDGPVWQRSYHDEIIQSEQHLGRARVYIANNPAQGEFDHDNPERHDPPD